MNGFIGLICLFCNLAWARSTQAPLLDAIPTNQFQEPGSVVAHGAKPAPEPLQMCLCTQFKMLLPCDAPECAAEKAEKEAKIKAAQEEQEAQHDVMDDARDNFGSIVEDYVSQNSPDGYFPLRQKGSGKTLKLRFKGLQPGSLKKVSAGHVAGVVAMTNAETRRLVMVDFFVDFSTPHWAVERASLAAPRSKAQGPAGSAGAH